MKTPPVLLLDMDGPLADFDAQCWEACHERELLIDIGRPEDQSFRYFTDHVISKQHRAELRRLIEQPGWFRNLPPVAGAIEGTQDLIRMGFDIWVCTKPLETNPRCRDDKAAWLREYLPELEHKLIITPDKSMVRGAILLDDAPKLGWIQRSEWRPVIFPAHFNGRGSIWQRYPRWGWGMDPEILHRLMGEVSRYD